MSKPFIIVSIAIALSSSAAADDRAAPTASDRVVALSVAPESPRISGFNRSQQIIVTALTEHGRRFDVTHTAEWSVDDSSVAEIENAVLRGRSNGRTELHIGFASAAVTVPVEVVEHDAQPPVHFENDVMPVFSKLGCNSGGCHGKASGQNGFKLSVFGFDPRADYNALVKQSRGRRVSAADPANSLLIRKMTGTLAHGGGRRTSPGSQDHSLVAEWVRQGTPWGADDAPGISLIRVEPSERVLDQQSSQQLLVTAVFTDGSERDVTSAASYGSNAPSVAEVDETGRVRTGLVPGEAAVTINYREHIVASRVLIPKAASGAPFPDPADASRIDQLVWDKLRQMGVRPSEPCDDATFLRRLHLDTLGVLPEPDEVRQFLTNESPGKRQQAVEHVLAREEFADYWTLRWADVLLVDRDTLGERGAYEFHGWLRVQMAGNRPYDEWVRDLITATGNSGKHGPVNFYRALRTPEELARSVSQAFLGVRLDCAQCHHHPFENWGQEDFYGLAGFFNGMQRRPTGNDRELVFHPGPQPMKIPLSLAEVALHPPGGDSIDSSHTADPRTVLADWITAPENPWFARLAVNRLWSHFLGRGLVEPVDDLRTTNPATNDALLSALAEEFIESDYDLRAMMRLILNSRVYQLSSATNESNHDDSQNYSHFVVRRLPAEVLLDAISQVTGTTDDFPGMPQGTRAVQVWDNQFPSYFLDTFGRSERKSPCECAKSDNPTMSQALHLMNAPEIEEKIASSQGRISLLMQRDAAREEIVEEICLAALGRPLREKELRVAEQLFADAPPQQAAEDFMWTVLNSYDFLFIH